MNRQECEFLIGCLLEDIRRVVRMYDENIAHVSLCITDFASRANAITDDGEYLLKVDIEKEVEEDDADC